MSIVPFAPPEAFDPDTLRAMGIAFDNSCRSLGLADRIDAVTETVAMRIIALARTGLRDPALLETALMASFKEAS